MIYVPIILLATVGVAILAFWRRRPAIPPIEQLAGQLPGLTVRYEAPNDTVISIDRARLSNLQFALVVEELLRDRLPHPMLTLTLSHADAASLSALLAYPTIEYLVLKNVSINAECAARWSRPTCLEVLRIVGGDSSDDDVARFLSRATEAVEIEIGELAVGPRTLEALRGAKQLYWLWLHAAALNDDALGQLPTLPALTMLDLEGEGISDRGLANLPIMPALAQLVLTGTKVTTEGVAQLNRSRPAVKVTVEKSG